MAICFCLFTGSLALHPCIATADEIVMDNGSRVKGTVTGMAGDQVTITSDYAEPIKLKTGKITSISTDSPVEIQTKGGEVLKGNLKTDSNGILSVEQTAGRERVVLDMKNIAAINPPPATQWSGSVVVAGNLQTGNTERNALRIGADAVRRSEKDRFSLRAQYDISEEHKTLASRSIYGSLKYDYFFSKAFYGYLSIEMLNDSFKDLNLRTIVGPGVGYQLLDGPRQSLGLEAGITYFSEDYRLATDKSWMAARLAANYFYKITDTVQFTNNLVLYPSLERLSDFNMRNEAAISTSLGSGWSMKLANILEFDNTPSPGKKKTDSNFLLGLQYAF
jgi:putative salt-induced outer membrane protein YdiY